MKPWLLRTLVAWRFVSALALLFAVNTVLQALTASHTGSVGQWIGVGFDGLMTAFFTWLTWHRLKRPRAVTVGTEGA